MSDNMYILKPAFTPSIVMKTLTYLVYQETIKRAGIADQELSVMEVGFVAVGRQQGYIDCLRHLLGSANEKEYEQAMDNESTLFDIVDTIVRDKIYKKFDDLQNWSEDDIKCFVNKSVQEYVILNPTHVMNATRFI